MQLVIDIPDSTFTDLKRKMNRTEVDNAILQGTPLSKGHEMKFLQISDCMYINAERIDGVTTDMDGNLKVFVGGSDAVWTVDKPYANDVLTFVHEERIKK